MGYFSNEDIDTRTCGQADEDAMLDRRDGLATAWASMSKRQRIAWLRSGNVLNTTSATRQTAVAADRRKAGGI